MSQLKLRKKLFVASVSLEHARSFAQANGVHTSDLAWLGDPRAVLFTGKGTKIWVIGEIGQEIAEAVHVCVVLNKMTVKYAERFDIVDLRDE